MLTPGHFDRFLTTDPRFDDWSLRASGRGLTALHRGKVLGFLFIDMPGGGLGRVFMIASDTLRERHWLWLGLAFRRGIEEVPRNLGITTLEVEVPVGFWKSRTWVERLGFKAKAQTDDLITYTKEV